MTHPSRSFARTRPPARRRGFSFTEILFAILILGIGFILVAGIFPVAIRQTQATAEETTASTIARGGVTYLEKYVSQSYWTPTPWTVGNSYTPGTIVQDTNFYICLQSNVASAANRPSTPTPTVWAQTTPGQIPAADGQVHLIAPLAAASEPASSPLTNTFLWPQVSGNLILPSDSRYAWIPMYRQDSTMVGKYLQVIVIGVQARNRSFYDGADLVTRGTNSPVTLQARPLQAAFGHNSGTPGGADYVTLSDLPNNSNLGAAVEGAYLVVANDGQTGAASTNGFIYRLGNAVGGNATNTFELAPGNDMTGATVFPPLSPTTPLPPTGPLAASNPPVVVYLIGRGYDDGSQTTTTYSGPTQDIAAYSTFIVVH